jgi:hypothetical protein
VLRNPGNGLCFIQQTRNENHMLPIEFDPAEDATAHSREGVGFRTALWWAAARVTRRT